MLIIEMKQGEWIMQAHDNQDELYVDFEAYNGNSKEEKNPDRWKTVRDTVCNKTSFFLAQLVTFSAALYSSYSRTSKSSDEIQNTFTQIIAALQDNATAALNFINTTEAKPLIDQVQAAMQSNPDLAAMAKDMENYILQNSTSSQKLLEIAMGGPAFILSATAALYYLEELAKSIQPGKKSSFGWLFTGVTGSVVTVLQILRANQCFSDQYASAPSGYVCSAAEDPAARGFNNFLIQLGFMLAAGVTLSTLNKIFAEGLGGCITDAKQSVAKKTTAFGAAAVSSLHYAKGQFTIFFQSNKEGDTPRLVARSKGVLLRDDESKKLHY